MMAEGLSLSDYAVLNNDKKEDGGMFGGSGMWFILLFILLIFGGGMGGLGGANGATNMINNDFLYTNLKSTMDLGFNQLANQNFGIQKDLCQGFNGVNQNVNTLGYQMQNCCCSIERNIDALRYESAKNTCDITTAIHADGEATRALINSNTMQELRDQLQAAQLTLANASQTSNIINSVRPFPSPAYITCSPYTSPCGTGCVC